MGLSSPTNGRRGRHPPSGGFTLLEVMMGTLITAFVFAGVLSAYIFLGRALIREGNMESLESRTRTTLYQFNQDVSTSTSVTTTGMTSSTLVLNTTSGTTITYTYSAAQGTLSRQLSTSVVATTMLTGLTSFSFGYYDYYGISTSNPNAVKQINMTYVTSAGSAITGSISNFSVASPRVLLKNRALLQ